MKDKKKICILSSSFSAVFVLISSFCCLVSCNPALEVSPGIFEHSGNEDFSLTLTSSLAGLKRSQSFLPSRGKKDTESPSLTSSNPHSSSYPLSYPFLRLDSQKPSGMSPPFSLSPSSGEHKRGPSFFSSRGKKLVPFPYIDYPFKRAGFVPQRGRKDYRIDTITPGVPYSRFMNSLDDSGLRSPAFIGRFNSDSGWKGAFKWGIRGKKSDPMASLASMTSPSLVEDGKSITASETNEQPEDQAKTFPSSSESVSTINIGGIEDSSSKVEGSRMQGTSNGRWSLSPSLFESIKTEPEESNTMDKRGQGFSALRG